MIGSVARELDDSAPIPEGDMSFYRFSYWQANRDEVM